MADLARAGQQIGTPTVYPRWLQPPRGVIATLGFVGVGLGIAYDQRVALVIVGIAAVVFLQSLGWKVLLPVLIGSTFVTRFRPELLGLNFLPEHVVLAACLVALLIGGRHTAVVAAATDRSVLLLGAFVAWSAVVSIVRSPQPTPSLQIVGWLALDWLLLVAVLASTDDPRTIARQGTRWLGGAATIAIALWVAASAGAISFGVQLESTVGAQGAYGLSYESNILAATLAVWAFVALTCPGIVPRRARNLIVVLAGMAIALSLTRAAVVGLAAGLLVWALMEGLLGWRVVVRMCAVTVGVIGLSYVVAPNVVAPIATKAGRLFDFGSGNGQLRVSEWKKSLGDISGADWLVGLGTNSYGQRHLDPTRPDLRIPAYLGNLPLQVVYDSGIVGAGLLCGAVVRVIPKTRRQAARALGLLTVYVACAVATSPFWFGTTWVLMAMAVLAWRRHVVAPLMEPPLTTADAKGDLLDQSR